MPLYTFECKKCATEYEVLTNYDKTGKYKKAKCPECGSSAKIQTIGQVAHNFGNPEGTDKMNTHDYRYWHSIDKKGGARDQREQAAKKSHMGDKPYNDIDDISSGKFFGDVK